jgi:hypothetical protein
MAKSLVRRINFLTELRKVKRATRDIDQLLALEWAIDVGKAYCEEAKRHDTRSRDVAELERLFGLEDPRP